MSTVMMTPRGLGASKANVEKFAEDIADHVKFLPGDSIEELVERVGGNLVVGSSGSGDAESGSIVANAVDDFVIYVSRHTSLKRDRFTIAHELGHLLLHLDPIKKLDPNAGMRATRWVDETDQSQKRAEWEANWFAAGFLMPSAHFVEDHNALGLVGVISKYGVSATAAEIRAKSLGLVN
jgi:Zn-dependent peptidase ImmA (M78 family)